MQSINVRTTSKNKELFKEGKTFYEGGVTNGFLLGEAARCVFALEHDLARNHERIDWYNLSKVIQSTSYGLNYKERASTYSMKIVLGADAEKGIKYVREQTAQEPRFEWKRSGGVYTSYAICMLLFILIKVKSGDGSAIPTMPMAG